MAEVRDTVKGCTKGALGKTNKCIAHGGGKRCFSMAVLGVLEVRRTVQHMVEEKDDVQRVLKVRRIMCL